MQSDRVPSSSMDFLGFGGFKRNGLILPFKKDLFKISQVLVHVLVTLALIFHNH